MSSRRKSNLQSLADKLQSVCKVARPGRSFHRQVLQLLKGTHHAYTTTFGSTGPFGLTWLGGTCFWSSGMGFLCCIHVHGGSPCLLRRLWRFWLWCNLGHSVAKVQVAPFVLRCHYSAKRAHPRCYDVYGLGALMAGPGGSCPL